MGYEVPVPRLSPDPDEYIPLDVGRIVVGSIPELIDAEVWWKNTKVWKASAGPPNGRFPTATVVAAFRTHFYGNETLEITGNASMASAIYSKSQQDAGQMPSGPSRLTPIEYSTGPTRRRLGYYSEVTCSDQPSTNSQWHIASPDRWNPGYKAVGTVIASGTFDASPTPGTTTAAVVAWELKIKSGSRTSVGGTEGLTMPDLELVLARQDANAVRAGTFAFDLLDDQGNWWRTAVAADLNGTYTVKPYLTGPVLLTSGQVYDAANPVKARWRHSSEDYLSPSPQGETPILYLTPEGVGTEDSVEGRVRVSFDVTVDAYKPGATEVTGDNPTISDGTNGWTANPNPDGSVDIVDQDGNVVGQLPAGSVNGPITLRLDGDTLFIVYDGRVLWLWKIPPDVFAGLNLSTIYVGLYDPETEIVTPVDPVFPPLGGWRYALHAWEYAPGIRPEPFRSYYRGARVGVTAIDYGDRVEFTSGGWDSGLPNDPEVTVYPGGGTYQVQSDVATRIAEAGGLEWLTEVQPPTP